MQTHNVPSLIRRLISLPMIPRHFCVIILRREPIAIRGRLLRMYPKMFISKSSTRVNKYAGICISNTTMLDILQDPGRKTQSIYMYCTDFMYDTEKSKLRRTYDNGGVWIQPYYDFFKNRIVGEVEYL